MLWDREDDLSSKTPPFKFKCNAAPDTYLVVDGQFESGRSNYSNGDNQNSARASMIQPDKSETSLVTPAELHRLIVKCSQLVKCQSVLAKRAKYSLLFPHADGTKVFPYQVRLVPIAA